MPRHMSFSMTTQAVIDRSKTVTRRLGWDGLKPGTLLWAVEKGMGLKKGEHAKKLALIRVVSVKREELLDIAWGYGFNEQRELAREGFPNLTAEGFVNEFMAFNQCGMRQVVNRIEFEYVEAADGHL